MKAGTANGRPVSAGAASAGRPRAGSVAHTPSRSLGVGVSLLAVLTLVAVIGPSVAPYRPDQSWSAYFVDTPEGRDFRTAPEPPSAAHPFGTNRWGYDLLTLMLYGARFTIAATALIAGVQVVTATALGLVQGLGGGLPGRRPTAPRQPGTGRRGGTGLPLLPGLPVLIILVFVLQPITVNSPLPPAAVFLMQVILLMLPGVPALSATVTGRVRDLGGHPMIESGIVAGAGTGRLIRRYVLPTLAPDLSRYFVYECQQTLTLVGQLGMFNIFLGGTIFTPSPPLLHSVTHEWAGLVGQNRANLQFQQWTVLFPLAGYLAVMLAVHLVAIGMERRSA